MGRGEAYLQLGPAQCHCDRQRLLSKHGNRHLRNLYRQEDIYRYILGLKAIKADFVACKQQRRRPACAFVQSDQRLCYLLIGKYYINACSLQNFDILATSETTQLTEETL